MIQMDLDLIIQCSECPFFYFCCDYSYRKLIDFLYVHNYPFRKIIVLLYTFWHGHPILGALLFMLRSWDYPIPGNLVKSHCGYLVKRNWPTFVSTWYTGILNIGFAGHVAILRLSHTWKSCRLPLRLSRKEKKTDSCINPIHGAFKYVVVVVTSLLSFTCPDHDPLSITLKSLVIIASPFLFCSCLMQTTYRFTSLSKIVRPHL